MSEISRAVGSCGSLVYFGTRNTPPDAISSERALKGGKLFSMTTNVPMLRMRKG